MTKVTVTARDMVDELQLVFRQMQMKIYHAHRPHDESFNQLCNQIRPPRKWHRRSKVFHFSDFSKIFDDIISLDAQVQSLCNSDQTLLINLRILMHDFLIGYAAKLDLNKTVISVWARISEGITGLRDSCSRLDAMIDWGPRLPGKYLHDAPQTPTPSPLGLRRCNAQFFGQSKSGKEKDVPTRASWCSVIS